MESDKQQVWRESASLVLIARTASSKPNDYDYNVLMLKRSDRTAQIKNQYVFPGGIFESSDETIQWLHYFKEFGVNSESLTKLVVFNQHRPRILASQGTGCYDRFFKQNNIWTREISLRIAAIRETFEEMGVLLCRSSKQLESTAGYANVKHDFDIKHWQDAVHRNPMEFLNLCKQLKVVPDLWALYEWSAWATPAAVELKKFETVFFISFLSRKPQILLEKTEVMDCVWCTPVQIMQDYFDAKVSFVLPQFYELSRLMSIKSIDQLLTFSKQRQSKGVTLYLPILYICTDGAVWVFPGDDFYLKDPYLPTANYTNLSLKEFAVKGQRLHRVNNWLLNPSITLNFEPLDGHLWPVNGNFDKGKL